MNTYIKEFLKEWWQSKSGHEEEKQIIFVLFKSLFILWTYLLMVYSTVYKDYDNSLKLETPIPRPGAYQHLPSNPVKYEYW